MSHSSGGPEAARSSALGGAVCVAQSSATTVRPGATSPGSAPSFARVGEPSAASGPGPNTTSGPPSATTVDRPDGPTPSTIRRIDPMLQSYSGACARDKTTARRRASARAHEVVEELEQDLALRPPDLLV